jgi:hypothetical protein
MARVFSTKVQFVECTLRGAQWTERDGVRRRTIPGVWAIFGHGNVAGLGEALHAQRDTFPTYRGHNEQTMAHAAIAFAKGHTRRRAQAVTSSIGPGATNMVTAAALAHVNRLPLLLIPGDGFANRRPDPVLQQVEAFGDGTISANDCFRPVVRYFDRITRPEQLLTALPRALRVMTDPAECGPVCLSFCQDVQAEAYDWPEAFFAPRVWHIRRPAPDAAELAQAVAMIKAAKSPVLVCGGGVIFSGAEQALAEIAGLPIAIADHGMTTDQIRAFGQSEKARGAAMLIVDNTKHIRPSPSMRTRGPVEQFRALAQDLKWIRDDLGLAVVVLHHLNKDGDVSWCDDVRKDADFLLFLEPVPALCIAPTPQNNWTSKTILEVKVEKGRETGNRNAKPRVEFIGAVQTFTEAME